MSLKLIDIVWNPLLLKTTTFEIVTTMDEHIQECLVNMKARVNELELTEWLIGFTPHPEEGFAWTRDPVAREHLDRISDGVDSDGHSGGSFAMCIRIVQTELTEESLRPPLTH
jgi:hypothetical protein